MHIIIDSNLLGPTTNKQPCISITPINISIINHNNHHNISFMIIFSNSRFT